MNRCSFPNCGYAADVITTNHTMTAHGLSKQQVIKQYGAFVEVKQILDAGVAKWIRDTPMVSESSFAALQSKRMQK